MSEEKILYISDLDETLLDKGSVLSAYTKSALNRLISQGVHFSVATGRTTDAALKIMAGVALNIPIVTFNGVVIYDVKHERYINVYRISTEVVNEILGVFKSQNISCLMYELKDNQLLSYYESLRHKPIHDFVEDRKARYGSVFRHVDAFADVPPENIIYFTLRDTYDHLKPAYDRLSRLTGINLIMVDDSSIDGLWWLEIFSVKASKENAVAFLRKEYCYTKVIGFGDNYNDLPMFKACDVRVAVENALDEIKNAADYICEAHDKDGVVKWIANYIL